MSRQRAPMDPREGRARMWQGMRVMRNFTVVDLQATAEVSRESAVVYVRALRTAGYLVRVDTKRVGRVAVFMHYRLVKNTGPHGPRVSRDGTVFDPNLEPAPKQATVGLSRAEYERALRCIAVVEKLRAFAPTDALRKEAATALEVVR